MKKISLLPVFMVCLASGLWAAADCSKSSDACKPQVKKVTPFMAALKKAENAPALEQGAIREIALKQGQPRARLVAASTEAAAAAEPAAPVPAVRPAEKEAFSKPAWLLAAAALLIGLYYFLKDGKGRSKRA